MPTLEQGAIEADLRHQPIPIRETNPRSSSAGEAHRVDVIDAEPMLSRSGRALLVVATLLAVVGMGACSSNQPAVCSSVDALNSSVQHLKNVNVSENGLSELRARLDQVKKDLQQVAIDAKQQYGSQMSAVSTSVAALESSLKAAQADPSAALGPVVTGVATVSSATKALQQAVANTC